MSNFHYLFFVIVFLIVQTAMSKEFKGKYKAVINFGDSLSDTGNYRYTEHIVPDYGHIPPYGETFFHHPAGRWADGRNIIDFIAEYVGVPFMKPFLEGGSANDFKQGVNFAVAGATANPNSYYTSIGINATWPKNSLQVQIHTFINQFLPLVSKSKSGYRKILENSLVMLGEIGGNDYFFSLTGPSNTAKSLQYVKANIVPRVIKRLNWAAEVLIKYGAKSIAIPGITPLGCVPSFLTLYISNNTQAYDPSTGCIKFLNDFSEFHNGHVQNLVAELQERHPHLIISYVDYYENLISIYKNPRKYGFKVPLISCCGGNGPYNWNATTHCGDKGANLCRDPSIYVSWDGVHYTEHVHKIMSHEILKGKIFNRA